MEALIQLMSRQHGVASVAQARALGVTWRVEQRLRVHGVVWSPCAGVLVAGGSPATFRRRAMVAALTRGVRAISHGAAARLHGLDGFDGHGTLDVLGVKGANPDTRLGVVVHRTRGPVDAHVVSVEGITTLSIPATLALLAPAAGVRATARALDSALRLGVSGDELRAVAEAWRSPGRSGPPALLTLLDERVDRALPRSWFQRISAGVLASAGIRLVDEHQVRDGRGTLLAELDLADPASRVGVECQRWRWHATTHAQLLDRRRRGVLRQLGWEIVDVWWSDVGHADRVIAELLSLLGTRGRASRRRPTTGRAHR